MILQCTGWQSRLEAKFYENFFYDFYLKNWIILWDAAKAAVDIAL